MIHDVLPADVEFARGMINASHSDVEILASLAARGLDPAKAARLLDDLRHGRSPSCQLPYPPEALFRNTAPQSQAAAVRPPPPPVPDLHPHRRRHHRSRIAWWMVIVALFFLAALGYALFETGRAISGSTAQDSKHDVPPAFAK